MADLNYLINFASNTQGIDTAGRALSGLQSLLATLGVSVGAMELLQLADQFRVLEAKVKLATGEGANFINGFEGVKQIANDTFTSVENTAELFAKITRAGDALNLSQKDALALTKTINQAIQLSGVSTASAEAAITQLSQGLSGGVLRGDEFNSVMEQSPRLAQAMADGLGVTIGQLRQLANDGKLTSEVVINSLKNQGVAIQEEFDKMPTTVADSLTQLKNNFLNLVGDIDKQINGSSGVASIIQNISKAIDDIDPATLDAVKEAFTQLGVIAKDLWDITITVTDSIGEVWNAFDGSTEAGEKVNLLTKIMQELSIFIGHISDGVKGIGIVTDMVFGGWVMSAGLVVQAYATIRKESTATGDALMQKGDEMVARAKKNVLEFESSAIKASENANKSMQQRLDETAEKSRLAYEQMAKDATASTGKQQEVAIQAVQDIVKANNGLLNAKAKAILTEQNLQAEIDETGKLHISQVSEVKKSFLEVVKEGKEAGLGFWSSLSDATAKAKTEADLIDIRASLEILHKTGEITSEQHIISIKHVAQRYKELDAELQKNIETFADIADASIKANNGIITSELEKQAIARGLKVIMDENRNVMISVAESAKITASEIKKEYSTVASGLKIDFDKATIGVNQAFVQSGDGIRKIANDVDRFKQAGIDASNLVIQGLQNMQKEAKNNADYQLLIKLWQDMGNQGVISASQMTKGLEETRRKSKELQDEINGVTDAYKVLGIQSQAELKRKAQEFKEAYEKISKDITATEEIKRQAYEKYAQSVIEANNNVVSSELKAQGVARGFVNVTVENGKISVKTANDVIKANNAVTQSMQNVSNTASIIGTSIEQSASRGSSALTKLSDDIDRVAQRQTIFENRTGKIALNSDGKEMTQKSELSTRTGIESFLKQAGLSQEQAMTKVNELWSKAGSKNGFIDWSKVGLDSRNFQTASMFLLKMAEDERYRQSSSNRINLNMQQLPNNLTIPVSNEPAKTINVNLNFSGKTMPISIDARRKGDFMAFIEMLERSQAISGM